MWLIGDRLYYLGGLSAVIAIPGAALALVAGLFGQGWRGLLLALLMFVGGVVVFVTGSSLKGHSYDMAARDGISSDVDEGPR